MSQPTPYTPTTDFSQQEANNASGRSTVNTAALDAEFANIETTLDQTLANLQLIQRDDGRLGDVTVEVRCLAPDVLNVMGGFNLTGLWQDSTAYSVNDICSNGAYTYVCKTAHTSGLSFDSANWIQFGFTAGADAAQAAADAQVSANSALASKNDAASSASAASSSASSASASASSASTSASTATTQANNASSFATAASNSAAAAAASAASISLPISVTNGGTGANNATSARSNLGVPSSTGSGASGTWEINISGEAATVPNLSITQAKLASSVVPLGVGQTWQNMTAIRAIGTTYTNSTGRPIFVSINATNNSNPISLTVDGIVVVRITNVSSAYNYNLQATVPSGSTYVVSGSGTIDVWAELR